MVKFGMNVIVTDDCEDEIVDSISAASKQTANIDAEDVVAILDESELVQVGRCTVFERHPRDVVSDVRGCV